MANFLKMSGRIEQRIAEYALRIEQIEAHLRRGEPRAARARMNGMREELEEFRCDMEFPYEMAAVGSQIGFFSGGGSVLRGRLPGAVLGAVAGWLFGQSNACSYEPYIDGMIQKLAMYENLLDEAEQKSQSESVAETEQQAG